MNEKRAVWMEMKTEYDCVCKKVALSKLDLRVMWILSVMLVKRQPPEFMRGLIKRVLMF